MSWMNCETININCINEFKFSYKISEYSTMTFDLLIKQIDISYSSICHHDLVLNDLGKFENYSATLCKILHLDLWPFWPWTDCEQVEPSPLPSTPLSSSSLASSARTLNYDLFRKLPKYACKPYSRECKGVFWSRLRKKKN